MLREQNVSFRLVREFIDSLNSISRDQPSNEQEKEVPVQISAEEDPATIKDLCAIAEESLLPDSIFKLLATHPSWKVREVLCDNPNLPVAIIQQLAQDQHPDVRYAIAENHNMPLQVLQNLCADENPYISSRAEKTLSRVRHSYGFGCTKADSEIEQSWQSKHTRLQNAM